MSIHLDHCDRGRQLIGRRKKYRAAIEAAGLIGKTAAGQDIAESYAAVRGKAGAAIELIAAFEERSKRDGAGWLHCLSAQWNSRDYRAIDARSTEANRTPRALSRAFVSIANIILRSIEIDRAQPGRGAGGHRARDDPCWSCRGAMSRSAIGDARQGPGTRNRADRQAPFSRQRACYNRRRACYNSHRAGRRPAWTATVVEYFAACPGPSSLFTSRSPGFASKSSARSCRRSRNSSA